MVKLTWITPDDARYEDLSVRGHNKRFAVRPPSFIVPASREEVVRAVEEAVRGEVAVTVRSGGCCYENFVGDERAGVVIDLAELNRVDFDPAMQAFAVEPGARLLDVYRSLFSRWGVTIPGGVSRTAAAGGHISGGGYGPLSRQLGICVDYLHAVEVVVVDEDRQVRVVIATADPGDVNHDLWWAHTGGGGGNFGIVTRYWLRSPGTLGNPIAELLPRPPATILFQSMVFPREGLSRANFRQLVGNFGSWHERNSEPGSRYAGLFSGLVLFAVHPEEDAGLAAILFSQIDGEDPDAEELLALYLAAITDGVEARSLSTGPQRESYLVSLGRLADAQDDPQARHKIKSSYMRKGYTPEQIDLLHDRLNGPEQPFAAASLSLQSYGCAVNIVASDATAVAQRDSVMRALFLASWPDSAEDAANLDWLRRLYRDMHSDLGGVPVPGDRSDGCYINFPDIDVADPVWNTSGVPWQDLYYKGNFSRLQQTKKKWDPLGVFGHALSPS